MNVECPDGPHRRPHGPNEDIAICPKCFQPSHQKRPAGETYGLQAADCSLPIDHDNYCQPGGAGHPDPAVVRGYWGPSLPNGDKWKDRARRVNVQ